MISSMVNYNPFYPNQSSSYNTEKDRKLSWQTWPHLEPNREKDESILVTYPKAEHQTVAPTVKHIILGFAGGVY